MKPRELVEKSESTAGLPAYDDTADEAPLGLWRVMSVRDLEATYIPVDRRRTLGRSSGDVDVKDATVSKRHLQIEPLAPGKLLVQDLGSRNGTRVDGVRVDSITISAGAVVSVGETLLVAGLAPSRHDAVFPALVGKSHAMAQLRYWIEQCAAGTTPALLRGESGVGKELVARALHDRGPRARMPFLTVNVTAIPDELIESTLFGHVRGGFTGATRNHNGLFREADGGTLLLDEIGDLPLSSQPKLLRAVEYGEIQVVGAERPLTTDVRIIVATSIDLEAAVAAGRFREDLYHRLSMSVGDLPSLRSRREDILTLARHFARGQGVELDLRHDTAATLLQLPWPGNVRTLLGCVHDCLRRVGPRWRPKDLPAKVLSATAPTTLAPTTLAPTTLAPTTLAPTTLAPTTLAGTTPSSGSGPALGVTESEADRSAGDPTRGALTLARGDVRQAARALKVSPGKVYRFLRNEGLSPDTFRCQPRRPPRPGKS